MGVRNEATEKRRRSAGRGTAIAALATTGLLVALAVTVILAGPQLLARSLPAALLQESDSAQALAERQTQERARLDSYGWVDKAGGVAHIPVAEAMQRMAETGLPVGAPVVDVPAESVAAADAEEIPAEVSFASHVLPILVTHCGECHGEDDPEEGLEVTSYRTLMLGSIYGPVIDAGDAEGSYLFQQISSGKMPKRGDLLSPTQIEIIRAWIDAGALDN